jgi:hypothetical protein
MQIDEGMMMLILCSASSCSEIISVIEKIDQSFSADFKMVPVVAA